MLTLGIDTAGEQGAVGLCRGAEGLSELNFIATLQHGEKLLPAIEASLRWGGVHQDELELLAVSTGPGSFTGLRIGMAVAKGLARALEVPLVGVPTLAAYAQEASCWPGPVYVLMPDRRELVYWAGYRSGEPFTAERVEPIESLLARVVEEPEHPLLIGPGVERHRSLIVQQASALTLAPAIRNRPSGLQVAWLGLAIYQAKGQDERDTLEPLYAQAPLAQAKGPNSEVE